MRVKIEGLRDQLSDLSKRNRSLRLLKLYDKWNFDLSSLSMIEDTKHSTPEQIIKKILGGSDSIFLINDQSTEEMALKACHRLTSLYRNVTSIEEQTGVYDLYIGYPFISGRMKDGTFIQAPVFLFPVRLIKEKGKESGWSIHLESKEEVLINRTLLLAFQKYNDLIIDEEILEDAKDMPKEGFQQWTSQLLQKYGIDCYWANRKIMPLHQYSQKQLPNSPANFVAITPYLVLGYFSQGNTSILKDYDELLSQYEQDPDLGLVNQILTDSEEEEQVIEDQEVQDNGQELGHRDKDKYYITDLDTSQEEVISSINEEEGLVVYGPPGTGKSQVIVNLITNGIARRQRVLVVCQKRAALDVVYQRLELAGLSDQVALVHDANADRKSLYRKIRGLISHEESVDRETIEKKVTQLSEEIEKKDQYLTEIAEGLWKKQPCGLSAYELYSTSKALKPGDILLDLEAIPEQIGYETLNKSVGILGRLGNYYGQYGYETYPWIHRKSFNNVTYTEQYQVIEILKELIQQGKVVMDLKERKNVSLYTPKECWDKEGILSNGLEKVGQVHEKKWFSRLDLWVWTRRDGKEAMEKLGELPKMKEFRTDTWQEKEECLSHIVQYGTEAQILYKDIEKLGAYLKPEVMEELKTQIEQGSIPVAFLELLKETIESDFDALVEMDQIIEELDQWERQLLLILLKAIPPVKNEKLGAVWQEALKMSFYIRWIDIAEQACPKIKHISTKKYEEVVEEYRRLMEEKKDTVPQYLKQSMLQVIGEVQNGKARKYREIGHQVSKMRKVWPIRKLIHTYWSDGILDILPVWLVSPETVSAIFPMVKGLFDLVIFDEASQCPVENGIPSFYRAKKVVVAGDEKQLAPFDLFKVGLDLEEEGQEVGDIQEFQSLLGLGKKHYSTRLLAWHYRSKYEELINYSNYAFYDGSIQIAPNVTHRMEIPPIQWKEVDGLWEDQCNIQEAEEVGHTLKQLFQDYPDQSVGVITFNKKQQDLIQDTIEAFAQEDPEFEALYSKVIGREVDERLFVKNIENVQGDERDIIVFSVGYGKNPEGKVSVNFGTLNKMGGENRLNVAVSRAKQGIIVLCSVHPDAFDVSQSRNLGPKRFHQYLRYAHAVAHQNQERVSQILEELNEKKIMREEQGHIHIDNRFEQEVYEQLKEKGYVVHRSVGSSDCKVDLAIVHPKDPARYILGIECDGPAYYNIKSSKEREIGRKQFLESKGWNITRIWSRNWWLNAEKEIERIENIVNTSI